MIPGSNLLQTALSVIAKQKFQYYAFESRTLQPNGLDVASYAPPVPATGSAQPVPRTLFQAYGLDFQKNYLNFYMPQSVVDIERDVSGDKIEFNCRTYQCLSKTDWHGIDGWIAVMAVEVPC